MTLTTWKLIVFRLSLMLLGWHPAGSRLIRAILLRMIRRQDEITYVAHANFLDVRELHPTGKEEPLTWAHDDAPREAEGR